MILTIEFKIKRIYLYKKKYNIIEVAYMVYKLLSKVYYQSNEEYEALYKERINNDDTRILNIKIHGNKAFYLINSDIHFLSMKIMELDKKVQMARSSLPAVAIRQFANKSLVDEILLTNDIEGVYSTRKEIKNILNEPDRAEKNKRRFSGLVTRYKMLGRNKLKLNNCEDIRTIYNELVLPEILMNDLSGAPDGKIFRKSLAEVTTVTQKVIHKGVYPESKIIECMEEALNILNDDSITMLIRIAIFHYLFGYIHPFYDGNGRTSRFISSYLLSNYMDNLISYRLSYTIKENISDYYDAFKICNDEKNKGDLTPFIIIFLEILAKAFEKLYEALYNRKAQLEKAYENLDKIKIFAVGDLRGMALCLVQAALFSFDGISVKELCESLELSESTVRKKLLKIENEGYLTSINMGKYKYYKFDVEKLG